MKKTQLREYAKLIATVGANVKKGQEVFINAELDQPEFVKMVVEECYKAGAKKVVVDWSYQPLTKIHTRYRPMKVLSAVEEYELERFRHYVKVLPARIYLISEDPDGLKGIKQEKFAKSMQARSRIIKPLRDEMENKYQWCIAAVPGVAWAKKVFPGIPARRAVEKLWDAILETSRAKGDAVKNWEEHNSDLAARCEYLNSLSLDRLHITAGNGTDITIGLIPDALFMAGGEYTQGSHNYFNPNIPTEEVFVTPMRGKADGIVYSSKPLSFQGQMIEDFSVEFKDGKVSNVKARVNEPLLKQIVSMDEGASMLGEVALVPYDSPISKSGLMFYNTLFDENAACHLALGMGFANCIRDYDKYTLAECREKGINDSIIHEDFMIGTPDMNVTGITRDGKEIQLFKDGNWAF